IAIRYAAQLKMWNRLKSVPHFRFKAEVPVLRKLAIPAVFFICGLFDRGFISWGQEKPEPAFSVYVVAVRGNCRSVLPTDFREGHMIRDLGTSDPRFNGPSQTQTILERFAPDKGFVPDERVKREIENEFKKKSAFRIVGSPDEADLVFHICNTHFGDVFSNEF